MATLAQRFQSRFDSSTRSRGRQYFFDELVALENCTDTRIDSDVFNDAGDRYAVSVVLNTDGTWNGAACSCPRFADGYLCKHIWATLLEADEDTAEEEEEFDLRLISQQLADLDSPVSRSNAYSNKPPEPAMAPWQRWMLDVNRQAATHHEAAQQQPLKLTLNTGWCQSCQAGSRSSGDPCFASGRCVRTGSRAR